MSWRPAESSDLATVEALLFQQIQGAMFLLGNLRDHGLGSDHPNGLRLWVRATGDGVFAITNGGAVLMMAPGAMSADWRAAGQLITDRRVTAVLGDAPQVRGFLAATGLQDHPCRLNTDDVGFVLDMTDLKAEIRPEEEIIPLAEAPRALIEDWRTAYEVEALNMTPEAAREKAVKDLAVFIANDSHRVLLDGGQPVAMSGYNAALAEAVQVGGVYTPPPLRGRGYARRVVGRHLLEVRARGVSQAVLFAANAAAAKAYVAVGFRPAGRFALVLFAHPARIRAWPVEECT